MATPHIQRVVVIVEQLQITLITVFSSTGGLFVLRDDEAVQRTPPEATKLLQFLRQTLLVVAAGQNVVDRERRRGNFHRIFRKIHVVTCSEK